MFETEGISDRLDNDWNIVVLSLAIDIGNITLGGAIRGIGQQGFASINYFIAYFIIDLPLSFYLCFNYGSHDEKANDDTDTESKIVQGLGLTGLWSAVCIAGAYGLTT